MPLALAGLFLLVVFAKPRRAASSFAWPSVGLPGKVIVRNAVVMAELDPAAACIARAFVELALEAGIEVLLVSGFRSYEEQERLYAQGRTEPGPIITHARPGDSWHNHGLAFDVVPITAEGEPNWSPPLGVWDQLGMIGESLELEWGARWESFVDFPHFQYRPGLSLAEAQAGARPPVDCP